MRVLAVPAVPAVLLLIGSLSRPAVAQVDPSLLSGLVWRNVGPFRGGRVTAVTGALGQPGTYYFGTPIGGLWKTTSAGTTWFPVFDGIKTVSSIGAVQVAPSDPNIVYVGTGFVNDGDGVYKSTDAGATWTHLGMDETRRISSILVDPKDPNLVLMGVLGAPRTAGPQRGVFRSTDGGKTWARTLAAGDSAGVSDLAWAFDHPEVILAATRGTVGFGFQQAGAATHLYKSTDEGVTWTEIKGGGLPPLSGRLSVAVAMHTNAQRMYVVGPVSIGLWRSDDGGASWRRMDADDHRVANGQGNYTSGVWVSTGNPDVVYTIATAVYRSTDGGEHFEGWKGSPGGDDPQVFWLDPTDPKRMFMGLDQGAQVSLDGGENWSSWYNQSTEQIYHISVDNQYPYTIFATQQDACAIQTLSRGDLGQITMFDWRPNPGFERGPIVSDPLDPKHVYALNMTAGVMRMSFPSGQWINDAPNIDSSLDLRANGDQPLLFTATNPHELLTGYQYVMATTDGGLHWRKLSGDLAMPRPQTGAGGGGGRAGAGASITALATSTAAAGVIWAGTTNGRIHVTKNHGVSWTEVSIPNVVGGIASIEASHFSAGEAYVALRAGGENSPSFYRTKDYGATWTKIVTGMPVDQVSGGFARVLRSDTKKAGLLFAGTESGMYVSFDDGDHWQSLMLNLPNSSYRDIVVKENDLVVATYGRGIFILDDMSPLRQVTASMASEVVHLFQPGDAVRVRRDVNGDTPMQAEMPHAENPPPGAIIYYSLATKPSSDITLDILDAAGHVVRHMSSAPIPPIPDAPAPVATWWLEVPQPLPTATGLNRVNWNIRYDNPPAFNHNYAQVMSAIPHETPYTPEGPLALPGIYTVKLTVDGKSYSQKVTVRNDPRSPASAADLVAQHTLQMNLYAGAKASWDGWHQIAGVREAVARALQTTPPAEVATAGAKLDSALKALQGDPTPMPNYGRHTGPPNFAALNGTEPGESIPLESMNGQLRTTDYGDMAPSAQMVKAWHLACTDLKTVEAEWTAMTTKSIPEFNALLSKSGLSPVALPAVALPAPQCGSTEAVAGKGAKPATGGGR